MLTIGKKKLLASQVDYRGARVFTDDGEVNAGSKRDLLKMLASLTEVIQENDIVTEEEASTLQEKQRKHREERREVLAAIMADKTGDVARQTGVEMAQVIYQSVTRVGLMRQLLQYEQLAQGERPEVSVETKGLQVAVMTGPTQARLQIANDFYLLPPEVEIVVRLLVPAKRVNQSREDILQRKFNEGLEAILVGEDRLFKVAADALIDANGQATTNVGAAVTPQALSAGMSKITQWGLPLENIIFASNLWTGMALNRDFELLIDPVTRLEILRTGRMGSLMGAQLLTDAARDPNLKVLEQNEIYYTSAPQYVGEFTDRGGVQSEPIGAAETAINGAGWHMVEYLSLALPNYRAIARTRFV